jgi:hypothetical protein
MKNLSRASAIKDCAQILVVSLLVWTVAACSSQKNEYMEVCA